MKMFITGFLLLTSALLCAMEKKVSPLHNDFFCHESLNDDNDADVKHDTTHLDNLKKLSLHRCLDHCCAPVKKETGRFNSKDRRIIVMHVRSLPKK